MLTFNIVTLFPEMFDGPFSASIIGRAVENGIVSIEIVQLRDYATDKHRTVDDTPFGGGPGMVLKPGPLFRAVDDIENRNGDRPHTVLLSPQGATLTHSRVAELSEMTSITLVCGHYEGVDQRFIDEKVDEEISIGDYVLTGGELPAMVLVDAITRLLPGVLGDSESAQSDSFAPGLDGLLQGPVYTRPSEYEGLKVPHVLLSGNHAAIEKWRREQAVELTNERRPDLLEDWPT